MRAEFKIEDRVTLKHHPYGKGTICGFATIVEYCTNEPYFAACVNWDYGFWPQKGENYFAISVIPFCNLTLVEEEEEF